MADEKTIVLKIETITDQAVMEAYGKTLNSVLRGYEENNALISEYTQRIKENNAAIKAIQKEGERWGKLTERQSAAIRNMTAENEKLKIAKAELVQITKNQIKVDTTEAGSMENKSQLLGKLRMAWRKMTDEQKNANQGMLQTIQQLDASLKQADGSIGNFQRNVGDYKGQIGQLIGQFPKLGGAISKFAGPAGVISLATGAFNLLKSAMASTQTTGDAIQIEVAAWQGTWDRFLRMIATADFSNFIEQLTGAYDAAKELAEVRDEMFEKENSIRLLKAEQSVEEQKLLMTMRDQTKSEEERIKAGKRYQELVMQNAQLQKKAYEELADAELTNLAMQAGATEENLEQQKIILKDYITNYANGKKEEVEILKKSLEEERDAIVESRKLEKTSKFAPQLYRSLTKEETERLNYIKDYLSMLEGYNNLDDNIISSFVSAQIKAGQAESNALQSAQRAVTTTKSLIAKEARNGAKEAAEAQKKQMKRETAHLIAEFAEMGKELHDAVSEELSRTWINTTEIEKDIKALTTEMLHEIGNEIDNATDLGKQTVSPLARALGVSDDELKQIKDHALQAAGQIFNSIAQLSNNATQRRLKDELDAIEKEAESEKAILEGKFEKGVLTQKEYEQKLAEIDEQTAERKEQANKEAFEKQKRWNIAQALMNAAMAITKTFAEYGGTPIAWVMSAITAATTAAEIAVIASQKYARGGELHGPSHAQGGIKGFVGNQHIEAEGGEVIINKRSSAKHRKLLSLINSDNGWGDDFAKARSGGSGRFFARGGMIGGYDFRISGVPDNSSSLSKFVQQQTDNLRASFDAINRRIDNLRVSVLLSDIEAKSNEKRVHISRAVL